MARAHDLVIFGATGFTGRLVAEVMQRRCPAGSGVRWAVAGRSPGKLEAVARDIGLPDAVPRLVVDAGDTAGLQRLAASTRAVLTTVGPYQHHGEALLRACAEAGTDYVDLCGEPLWMARMIHALQDPARDHGARLVFSCGFDSIPFDLGVLFLQHQAQQRFGRPLSRVRGRVKVMKGTMSGGTVASALATYESIAGDPQARALLDDPFALTPGFRGPLQPDDAQALYDPAVHAWTAPFVMAPINTKNVHRTHALRGHPWGVDFVYDERQMTGDGGAGQRHARRMARLARLQHLLLGFGPTRAALERFALPKPGEGPDPDARRRGRYELLFVGEGRGGEHLAACVAGEGDPGYASTSRLITEAALCLLQDIDRGMTPGGVWTPGAAMGLALQRRLEAHAGLSFTLIDV